MERPPPTVTLREPKLVLPATEVTRLRSILDNAPGPTNMDRTKYQSVDGPEGRRLAWWAYSDATWQKLLKEEGRLLGPKYLIIGLYSYTLAVAEDRVVVWRQIVGSPPETVLRMSLFDTTSLAPLGLFPRGRPGDSVYYKSGLLAEVDLPGTWSPGPQRFTFPSPMNALPEMLLVVQTFPGWDPRMPRRALKQYRRPTIYVATPGTGEVEILDLGWTRSFEGALHWIARLGRDPTTDNIVGDGLGVKPFLLDNRARFLGWITSSKEG